MLSETGPNHEPAEAEETLSFHSRAFLAVGTAGLFLTGIVATVEDTIEDNRFDVTDPVVACTTPVLFYMIGKRLLTK